MTHPHMCIMCHVDCCTVVASPSDVCSPKTTCNEDICMERSESKAARSDHAQALAPQRSTIGRTRWPTESREARIYLPHHPVQKKKGREELKGGRIIGRETFLLSRSQGCRRKSSKQGRSPPADRRSARRSPRSILLRRTWQRLLRQ